VPLRLRQPAVILLPVTSLAYAITSGLMRPAQISTCMLVRAQGVGRRHGTSWFRVRHHGEALGWGLKHVKSHHLVMLADWRLQ
jgi:hypothetical protein